MTRQRKDVDHDAGFKRAVFEEVSREQLAAEYGNAKPVPGIPTTMVSGDGRHRLQMAPTQVKAPNAEELALFSNQHAKLCGHCKYFDLETGRKEIVRQGLGQKLVRDYEWRLEHVGDLDALALCGASGGEMTVQFVSLACDQFRPRG